MLIFRECFLNSIEKVIICFDKSKIIANTMPKIMLTDIQWELLRQVMKNTGRFYDKTEHRMTFEGILYRMRTGIPWRDLPPEFGEWSTVYRRFNLWSKKGVLDNLFRSLSSMADFEWVFLDGSIVRAHCLLYTSPSPRDAHESRMPSSA